MSDEPDESEKTEEPTSKKLEDSRKKGQVALSREVNHWVMLLAATIMAGFIIGPMFFSLFELLKTYLEMAHTFPSLPGGFAVILKDSFWEVLSIMTLPFLILLFAAFIGPFMQVGPLFSFESLKPDLSKISPVKGFGRLFSLRSLMEFVKGVFKLAAVAIVGYILIRPYLDNVEHTINLPWHALLAEMKGLVLRMMGGILIVLLVIAVADLVYQRYEHYKKMRMTKQEIKDEHRQSEGDPLVKSKLRQLRMEKARQRMMQAVPEADVIITNPTHFSIALKYDQKISEAPIVVAKGVDEVAMRIREIANEHDIILYEDRPLARTLYDTVEIDDPIPTELYKAVAEIISFVFQKKGKI
jgi:flagellar biosynthetic protein FlhB